MTDKDMFDDVFPQDKQIGGSYKFFTIQPFEFMSKNELVLSRQRNKIRL